MWWISILIGVIVAAGLTAFVLWWLNVQFPELARTALKTMGEDFLRIARGQLDLEHQKGVSDLESRRQAVQNVVKGLEEKLQTYEQLIKDFEKDRAEKYGQLKEELNHVITGAHRLEQTTTNLVAVLGNARVRGQWGQKMADDILRFCGLQEGIHYRKEQEIGSGRPDYTFLLPDEHCLFMDVKFPLDNYLKVFSAPNEAQPAYRDTFLKDLREHFREMERRDYLAQTDRTVDYLLIFIPNEQVYGLINEWEPGLIDTCLQKKMILCGPWTFYAIVRIIWQAWQHYHSTQTMKDIVRVIHGFLQDYKVFQGRFEELGGALDKALERYEDIRTKSYKRLEQRIQRIEEYRKGQGIPASSATPDTLMLEPVSNTGGEEA